MRLKLVKVLNDNVTHVAFSDESGYTSGRYRSLGMISLPMEEYRNFKEIFLAICANHGFNRFSQFKWKYLRSADMRNCVEEVIDLITRFAISNKLRIDVIIWDVLDKRHNVIGRDDSKNLAIMYYKLFNNVFMHGWPDGSIWDLYPDQNNIINWETLSNILNHKGLTTSIIDNRTNGGSLKINFIENYCVDIHQSTPSSEPMIQIADLYAGMCRYSYTSFDKWEEWKLSTIGQTRLFNNKVRLTGTDKQRCHLLDSFKEKCDENRLGISLSRTNGLRTWNPINPINFWFYVPKREDDMAPIIRKGE